MKMLLDAQTGSINKITHTIKGVQKNIKTSFDVTFYKECTIRDWNVYV